MEELFGYGAVFGWGVRLKMSWLEGVLRLLVTGWDAGGCGWVVVRRRGLWTGG